MTNCRYHHHHHPISSHSHDDCDQEHHHNHDHSNIKDKKLLTISFIITFVVMIVEIIGGIYANSLALISDAVHMFTHSFALGLSLFAIVISAKNPNNAKTFGYFRAEILAAFINGITIALSVVWIIYEAIIRLLNPTEILATTTIIIAFVGLIVNIITGLILLKANHDNINIKSAFLHMMADAISSVAIVFGAVVIYFTNWYIIDTLLAVFVAIIIAKWAKGLLSDSIHILLEGSPFDANEIKCGILKEFPYIKDIHDIHCWEISHNYYYLTCHIVLDKIDEDLYNQTIIDVSKFLEHRFGIGHTTIQVEKD
ncbi:MAG: cation diffusion facilitator family transporter [Arcobacteraceae bacterium]|nr:cation diffusion facilitator family transporter [Arcobacteraceae bacterium]